MFLPELIIPTETSEDVEIRLEANLELKSIPESPYSVAAKNAYLHFKEVGTFFINEGREIVIQPLPKIEERLIRLPLLGAAFAVLLNQRGYFVLHSSAVAVGNKAVAFLGNKGDGKSTMAAMLTSRGHYLLSDDTVAIDFESESKPMVLPGFPQFKLYPDAVMAAFNEDPDKLEEIASNVNKRSRLADNFCGQILPLQAIFVFAEGEKIKINRLSPQEAINYLIANSYMARFSNDWLQNGVAVSNLKHCAMIVNQIPVYKLERPRYLSKLEDVAFAVEKILSENDL